MTSTCQFIAKRARGLSSRKQHAAKLAKSSCSSAPRSRQSASPAMVASGMVNRLLVGNGGGGCFGDLGRLGRFGGDLAAQPGDEQIDDFPVGRGQLRRLGRRGGTGLLLAAFRANSAHVAP